MFATHNIQNLTENSNILQSADHISTYGFTIPLIQVEHQGSTIEELISGDEEPLENIGQSLVNFSCSSC